MLAHADGLAPDTAQPARLALRFSQADVMATPVDQVQVVHTTDNGQDVLLPDCAAGALPSGLYSCIQRPVTRDAQNTYVTVLTVTTSRWHLRRGLPVANQGAPTAPQNLKVAVGDGSALKVSWVPPASPGAGPVSSYRVTADGKTKATTSGTSAVVKNLGPGKHAIRVVAVNAAGPSPTVGQNLKLDKLSKPRKVKAAPGAAGGQRTAKVTWKGPADAGGFVIKRYQVAVLNGSGAVIARKVVAGSKHALVLSLGGGQFRFQVRARNKDGFGPWSKKTDLVRPR